MKLIAPLIVAFTLAGCVVPEHTYTTTQPTHHPNSGPRLTDWMENHHNQNLYGNRVCYREVIHNNGHTVVREINCQGRVLTETVRYNRTYY